MKQDNTSKFVDRANLKHNNKYDYSEVEYINFKSKVRIICPKHDAFEQRPSAHLNGAGCPKCKSRKLCTEEFVARSNKLHNNKYNYASTKYINCRSNVVITCLLHGDFFQRPSSHLEGRGCPKCGRSKSINACAEANLKTRNDFIDAAKKIHLDKYDYSQVDYINTDKKVNIICNVHGQFSQKPASHLRGSGCSKCGTIKRKNSKTKSTEKFIKECNIVHDFKYDYSATKYIKGRKKVKIKCLEHGSFYQVAFDHLNGHGCPFCGSFKNEKIISNFLFENNIEYIRPSILITTSSGREINSRPDFYLPKYNLFIEYNGRQHYEPVLWFYSNELKAKEKFIKQQERDSAFRNFCSAAKVELIEIDGRKYTNSKLKDFLKLLFDDKNKNFINKVEKPWGYERWISCLKEYTLKELFFKKNCRSSLQSHRYKRETILVAKGKVLLTIGHSLNDLQERIVSAGEHITILPKTIHRIKAIEDSICIETSTSELFDVVRYSDDYNR